MRLAAPSAIDITAYEGSYRVEFQPTIGAALGAVNLSSAAILVDSNVERLHGGSLQELLCRWPAYSFNALERNKSLEGVERCATWLNSIGASRNTTLVAIGGGIVQDVAAFTAHIYHRGMAWVFLPTTLLAMADSCIGSKAGLNLATAKNQVGVYQCPKQIQIALGFLATLSDDDIRSGYGEIAKLAIIESRGSFLRLTDDVRGRGLRDSEVASWIRASLVIKKSFIEKDEYDLGIRRVLNYGHTFGHALESLTNYAVPHGLAVAWGMDIVNFLAVQRGLQAMTAFEEMHAFIREVFPIDRPPGLSGGRLLGLAKKDKKKDGNSLNLVLCRSPGEMEIVPTTIDDRLERDIDEYLASYYMT